MASGDYRAALEAFSQAAQEDKGTALHRFHMAQARLGLRDYAAAAADLTDVLRMRPDHAEAARQLGELAAARVLPANVAFNRAGLKAALDYDRINRDQIAEATVYFLARSDPLRSALEMGRRVGFLAAARQLCLKSTGELLRDELLQKAIIDNAIRMPDLEYLLTALRQVFLLELPAERFQDRALVAFIIAMLKHCWVNEYVWATGPDEEAFLEANRPDIGKALAGHADTGVRILLAALYRPAVAVVGEKVPVEELKRLRPNAVRDVIVQQAAEHADLQLRASKIRSLTPVTHETSKRVRRQYEGYPFPRWTSLGVLISHEDWRAHLVQPFGSDRLSFMDEAFEVLIAGCGTGAQAVAASLVYGPNARITALDLSEASLGYAERMAEKFGVTNVTFVQGDILELGKVEGFERRFKIIECTGVLHHMADPLHGWRCLNTCLADRGLMLIALYSEIARRRWTALKSDPAFPGEECDDAALRQYRRTLLSRPDTEVGPEFKGLKDLYTTSGFRDLFLHVSERRFTLPEIGAFLQSEGLTFRGFFEAQDFERFRQFYPDEVWPGSLDRWAQFEDQHPSNFAGMYYFWCDRG